jgi:EAL domain-containing protein (putative c-di-GMP-specific phosphodiesterase class I)
MAVPAGTEIFGPGDAASAAYLILNGSIDLYADDGGQRRLLATRRQHDLFGELALIGEAPRQSAAVAAEDSELVVITREIISARFETIDPLLRFCMSALLGRYSETVARIQVYAGRSPAPPLRSIWEGHLATSRDILAFEHELRSGIERNELDVHFQPIVRLLDRRLAGFEALVRWRHPRRGLLQPNDFIPLAEASGVISDITAFCIRTVGRYFPAQKAAALRRPDDIAPLFLSVNVSGVDLMQPAFAAQTVSILVDAGVEPEDIRLEVTESILMEDPDRCAKTLETCRAQGFKIAIDDFGTGYSSLNYLNTLPVTALKMDRSFTLSLLNETVGRKIIGAILQLGGELGLSVIAEGVEDELQAAMLQAMGCEFGQGYLFGRAVDQDGTLALIDRWSARPAEAPRDLRWA